MAQILTPWASSYPQPHSLQSLRLLSKSLWLLLYKRYRDGATVKLGRSWQGRGCGISLFSQAFDRLRSPSIKWFDPKEGGEGGYRDGLRETEEVRRCKERSKRRHQQLEEEAELVASESGEGGQAGVGTGLGGDGFCAGEWEQPHLGPRALQRKTCQDPTSTMRWAGLRGCRKS